MTRPLVLTADDQALDDLLRLAATAGVDVDVARDPAGARRTWTSASLIVVGPDQLAPLARSRLGRRGKVVVLGLDLDDASIWQRAVHVGAEHVVFLPDAETWLVEAFADAAEGAGREGVLVAVQGGRGGAGATTLSCALAATAVRRGWRVLLMDGDPLGGGIDLVFGGECLAGLRWPDLGGTRGRLAGQALVAALPAVGGLSLLSWDRGDAAALPLEAVSAVLTAARRCCDLVVADLPRSGDEMSRHVLEEATTALLVVPAEVRAAAAGARVALRSGAWCRDIRLVVRGPAPAGLSAAEVARALALPLAGELRAEPGLARALERGELPGQRPRSPLGALCGTLLDELLPREQQRAA